MISTGAPLQTPLRLVFVVSAPKEALDICTMDISQTTHLPNSFLRLVLSPHFADVHQPQVTIRLPKPPIYTPQVPREEMIKAYQLVITMILDPTLHTQAHLAIMNDVTILVMGSVADYMLDTKLKDLFISHVQSRKFKHALSRFFIYVLCIQTGAYPQLVSWFEHAWLRWYPELFSSPHYVSISEDKILYGQSGRSLHQHLTHLLQTSFNVHQVLKQLHGLQKATAFSQALPLKQRQLIGATLAQLEAAALKCVEDHLDVFCEAQRTVEACRDMGFANDFLHKILDHVLSVVSTERACFILSNLNRLCQLSGKEAACWASLSKPQSATDRPEPGCLQQSMFRLRSFIKQHWVGIRWTGGFELMALELKEKLAAGLNIIMNYYCCYYCYCYKELFKMRWLELY
jgi:hypothetical protein